MHKHVCLFVLGLLSLACGRGSAGRDQSSAKPPLTHRDSTSSQARAPVDSSASVRGLRITSLEARLYAGDSTPVSPNIIDNAQARLFNVAQLRLRITVTVKWPPQERAPVRLGLWARVKGKEVFSQDVDFVPRPDTTVHVQDFWLDHGDCDGMLIQAYAASQGSATSLVYRYIPYECAD